MFEILQDFEQVTTRFSPIVLTGPGLVAVIVGLFIWLGGLRYTRVLVAVLGAVCGGICGFFIIGRNIMTAAVLAAVAALLATIFHRTFIIILAACLAAAIGLAVGYHTRPYVGISQEVNTTAEGRISIQGLSLSVGESLKIMNAYMIDVSDEIKKACSQMWLFGWAIIAVLVIISITGGLYLWRLTSAVCCAVLGTILIFAGMVLLLLYKGSAPISDIYSRPLFYAGVFGAMTAFGTTEQLLICPWLNKKAIKRKEAKKDKAARGNKDWRTA